MKPNHWIWNILSIGVLAITTLMLVWFAWIFFDPETSLNPLPQPTLPVLAVLPSATPEVVPSATQTATALPSPTATITPTATSQPTIIEATPVQVTPTLKSTAQNSKYSFVVQGDIEAIESALVHPAEGCNWQGISGQVFNLRGAPILYMGVQIGGRYNGRDIAELMMTGYGPDYVEYGYEYKLGDQPVDSKDTLWVRLVDQQYLPLSDKIYISTYADCTRNLVILNFKQIR